MDFFEGLPKSHGKDTVLVVVDRLTKYAHFIGLKHPFSAHTVASEFVKEIVRLHGFPSSIVSDRDKVFLSIFWKVLFHLQGTELKYSSAYHPQTDGQSEAVNKTLETYLRCYINGRHKSWMEWLPWAEYSYNTSPHSSTKVTPFLALYGRNPPHLGRNPHANSKVGSLEDLLQERDSILDELKLSVAACTTNYEGEC